MANVSLPGSERTLLAGSEALAPVAPDEHLEVTVLIRRRAADAFRAHVSALASGERPLHLSREEFAARHGADPSDFAALRRFAAEHGLTVTLEHAGRRTMKLAGNVRQFVSAFGVELRHCRYGALQYRGRSGSIQIPAELKDIVVAVLGFDTRPQAQTHFRVHRAAAAAHSFTPPQVAALYGFPRGTGNGQCVAIIELGGGFSSADLATYFAGLGVSMPQVLAVPVDGADNAPLGDPSSADGEVMLDVEVVGAIAPGARLAVYFAPNTDAGFVNAITSAIHDTSNKPSVISISWGSAESSWTAQAMAAMDEAFQAAAAMGVSVCVASGDNGSSDGVADGRDHVDFPASSPFALACGGTSLTADAKGISSETVWNDAPNGGATGGGVSAQFAVASWQANLSAAQSSGTRQPLARRGVPDVAGNADPRTGYQVRVDGSDTVIGGTSAVAPLWAALIALLNEAAGRSQGYLNPKIYPLSQAFRDITQGNNGDFAAARGWDACTGLGSPVGATLQGAL
jgi:kumamolisin